MHARRQTIHFTIVDSFLSRVLIPDLKESALGDLWEAHNRMKKAGKNVHITRIITAWRSCLLIKASVQIYCDNIKESVLESFETSPSWCRSSIYSLVANYPSAYTVANKNLETWDVWASSEPFPIAIIHREKVIPLNATPSDGTPVNGTAVTGVTREMAAIYSELNHVISGLKADITGMHAGLQITQSDLRATQADLQVAHAGLRATQADLHVAQEQIQALKQREQRTYDELLRFQQQLRQESIQQSQIRLNQDQQMERRVLKGAEDFVKIAFHNERERSIRVRRPGFLHYPGLSE
jgi:hypothetical protein